MSGPRTLHAARLAAEMRAPLARIELAASALARELATPRGRALTAGISDAVAVLDGALDRVLALLTIDGAAGGSGTSDLHAVLAEVHARLAPVLRARGVEWCTPRLRPPAPEGDGAVVRHALVALLRAASAGVGPGGRLRTACVCGERGLGLVVEGEPRIAGDGGAAWTALERFALSHGAVLERRESDPGTLELWLPAPTPEEPCGAS